MTQAERRSLGRLLLGSALAVALATVLGGAGAMVIGLVATWLVASLYARPGAREHAKLPDLSGEKAFPVTLNVWHNRRKVGRENGWVAFVDGWIVYEGLRTSFSVRVSDVQSMLNAGGSFDLWFPEMGAARLSLLTDYMQTSKPAKLGSRADLSDAYNLWRNGPIPEGRPIFPPVQISPRVFGERTAEFSFGVLALALLGFLFGLAAFYVGTAVTAVGAVACVAGAMRNYRALRNVLAQPMTALPRGDLVRPVPLE
jgi:hypothetical protein